jgi:trimethylamine corrinoid protein
MPDFAELQEEFGKLLLGHGGEQPIDWARQVLDGGVSAIDFFNEVFTPALVIVGEKFGRLEIFLPELMDAAERAKTVSDGLIKPILAESHSESATSRGRVVICSVQGDLHDIGKNMVSLMLQVNGFEVIDMGVNVPPREVLAKAKEVNADIVGLSSLMTTSMPYMKEVVELRDGFGRTDDFMVIVGGAPITSEYSAQIGANAFGRDAVDGVARCLELMAHRRA